MVWFFLILIILGAIGSVNSKGRRKTQKKPSSSHIVAPRIKEFFEIPRHRDQKPMTKREAQIWRKMQRVVTEDWSKIGTMVPGNCNAFTPGKAYYGVIVHVYGEGRLKLTSIGLGDWEADFSQDGQVGVPRRVEEEQGK